MQPAYIQYLTLNDYLTTIRSDQLNNQLLDAIEEGGDFERQEAESFAIGEVRKILNSFFYLDFEFRPLLPFSFTKKYYAGDRCIIDFDEWIPGVVSNGIQDGEDQENQYKLGDCVIKDRIGYCCKVANSDTQWVAANWINIGNQYDIYFVNYPYQIFQLKPLSQIGIEIPGLYSVGDKVCWGKKLYKARNSSFILSHQAREQYYEVNDIPSPNMFPNQIDGTYTDGNRQWIDKGEFYFKGVLPFKGFDENINDDVDAWTEQYRKGWIFGDNRSAVMKQIVIAIAISKLMSRNSFQLKERAIERDRAYRTLEDIKKGEATTLIPILQPDQGIGISFGGMPKIINTF